jgi:hypothetical protein
MGVPLKHIWKVGLVSLPGAPPKTTEKSFDTREQYVRLKNPPSRCKGSNFSFSMTSLALIPQELGTRKLIL